MEGGPGRVKGAKALAQGWAPPPTTTPLSLTIQKEFKQKKRFSLHQPSPPPSPPSNALTMPTPPAHFSLPHVLNPFHTLISCFTLSSSYHLLSYFIISPIISFYYLPSCLIIFICFSYHLHIIFLSSFIIFFVIFYHLLIGSKFGISFGKHPYLNHLLSLSSFIIFIIFFITFYHLLSSFIIFIIFYHLHIIVL